MKTYLTCNKILKASNAKCAILKVHSFFCNLHNFVPCMICIPFGASLVVKLLWSNTHLSYNNPLVVPFALIIDWWMCIFRLSLKGAVQTNLPESISFFILIPSSSLSVLSHQTLSPRLMRMQGFLLFKRCKTLKSICRSRN